MIPTSQDWKDYSEHNSIYHIQAVLTDTDGNSLNLDDNDFMLGSVSITDSTSDLSSFDIGTVITNTFQGTLNNIDGKFNNFKLSNSTLAVKIGINPYSGKISKGNWSTSTTRILSMTDRVCVNELIPVEPNTGYTIHCGSNVSTVVIIEYNSDGERVKDDVFSSYDLDASFTTASTTNVIGINFLNNYGTTYLGDFTMGDELSEWIDRGVYTVDKPSSLGYTIEITAYDFMDRLNRYYTGKRDVGDALSETNLFDDGDYTSGKWLTATNGENPVNFGYYSHYISVTDGKNYGMEEPENYASLRRVNGYDSSYNYLGTMPLSYSAEVGYYFTASIDGATVAYIRKNGILSHIGKDYVREIIPMPYQDIVFPVSSSSLAEILCEYCGVQFDSWNLMNDLTIEEPFEYNESTTCREVLAWLCQINCGFAKLTPSGKLIVKWYSSGSWGVGDDLNGGIMSPWGSAENFDGGTMQPWSVVEEVNGGFEVDTTFNQIMSSTVSTDEIQITGIRVYVPNTVDDFDFATVGYYGYILAITDNPLVTTNNKEIVANAIYRTCKGMRFRIYEASVLASPSIEAGDIICIADYLGTQYFSYITNMTYRLSGTMDVSLGAEQPTENTNEYSNANTSVLQGAATSAYDYIRAKKISADYISAGTIEATVIAKDFKLEGGSIAIETNDENADWINLNLNSGTGRYTSNTSPTLMGIAYDYDYYADFIGNRFVNVGLEVGRWEGQTQVPVLTADALGNVYINGTGTATFSGAVTASSFVNSSRIDLKENLQKVDSVLDKIKGADILEFNFVDDVKKHIGLAIGGEYSVPEEVIAKDDDGEEQGVDLYSMVSMAWKAIQEQQTIIEELEKRIEVLEKKLNPIGTIKDIIKGDNDGNTNS